MVAQSGKAVDSMGSCKAQLWRLLVVASVDPRLWAEKGADGGELEKVKPRQFDGLVEIGRLGVRQRCRER